MSPTSILEVESSHDTYLSICIYLHVVVSVHLSMYDEMPGRGGVIAQAGADCAGWGDLAHKSGEHVLGGVGRDGAVFGVLPMTLL